MLTTPKNCVRDKEIEELFVYAKEKLTDWLQEKPTGKYCLVLEINQGGVRSKEIKITNKI